jgi:hypothetical protein
MGWTTGESGFGVATRQKVFPPHCVHTDPGEPSHLSVPLVMSVKRTGLDAGWLPPSDVEVKCVE